MNLIDIPIKKSFFFKNGHRALNNRAISAEIFYPESLRSLAPSLRALVNRYLQKIKKEVESLAGEEGVAELDLQPRTMELFSEIVGLTLFGEKMPKVEGKPISTLIEEVANGYFKNNTSLLHFFSGGVTTKLGLSPLFNELEKSRRKIYQKIEKVVKERSSQGYQRGLNVIDLIITKNEQLQSEGRTEEVLTMEEIVDTIIVVIFAGVDTTRSLTQFAINHLSKDLQLQDLVRATVKNEIFDTSSQDDYDAYASCKILNNFIKEALRLYSPVWLGVMRRATKDFKLGQFEIGKGSVLTVVFASLHQNPNDFDDPLKFDLGRYEDESKVRELSKSALIPFSTGKRACIGRNLGDLTFKLILAEFVQIFDIFEASGTKNCGIASFTYGLDKCDIKLRCR